ncbi:MAG: membrane integrity-associated transporter subunit PqiC [Rhodospirillaceae bacterium]|nr:membrane integrity-associated transporter subunit PqiC [Rhodospirillales bacterium]
MGRSTLLTLVALLAAGCGQLADPNLYVIVPAADAVERTESGAEPLVAVARVSLPEYLDRSQLVSRSGANALVLDDDNRWGEPLADSVPRVLSENLSRYLPGGRVVTPEEARGQKVPYEYVVALDAYEPDGQGNAVMRGHWLLRDTRKGNVMAEGMIDERRPMASTKAPDAVAALNENLSEASRQIAQATAGKVRR